ncbi:hypothetical protein ACWHLZ_29095 [Streptomyces chartreusis]
MNDHAAYDDTGLEPAQALRMPQQVPPVDRNEATPVAALSDNPAVQANGIFGVLDKILPF